MIALLQHRLRVTLSDTRQITGQLLAFDVHMNLVLSDAQEYRTPKHSTHEEKRTLGLVILRGEWVISITVEGPPPSDPRDRIQKASAGQGVGRAIGRGTALGGGAVPGLSALTTPLTRTPNR